MHQTQIGQITSYVAVKKEKYVMQMECEGNSGRNYMEENRSEKKIHSGGQNARRDKNTA